MPSPYRLASIAIALAGFSSAAHAEYLIDFYIPQYPAHFAPIGSASQPVMRHGARPPFSRIAR
jgi:hypothetical protein